MKLLDQVRRHMRTAHYAIRTEKTYLRWIKRFLVHQKDLSGGWRHPSEMGSDEVNEFLTWLAVEGKVSASTRWRTKREPREPTQQSGSVDLEERGKTTQRMSRNKPSHERRCRFDQTKVRSLPLKLDSAWFCHR